MRQNSGAVFLIQHSAVKESYMAQNSLVKTPFQVLPAPSHSRQNKELSYLKEKKWDLRLIMPNPQPIQPLANLQNSMPRHLRDN